MNAEVLTLPRLSSDVHQKHQWKNVVVGHHRTKSSPVDHISSHTDGESLGKWTTTTNHQSYSSPCAKGFSKSFDNMPLSHRASTSVPPPSSCHDIRTSASSTYHHPRHSGHFHVSSPPHSSSSSSKATTVREKSPFTRGQSRVFYASDYLNDDRVVTSSSSAPFNNSFDSFNQFRRSNHRSNSSYKSQDSGFSDSADAMPSLVETSAAPDCVRGEESSSAPSSNSTPLKDVGRSSARMKLAKWSSAATLPLKMLWRPHDGSKSLKCCVGLSPLFPFYHKAVKSSSSSLQQSSEQDSAILQFSPYDKNVKNQRNEKNVAAGGGDLSSSSSRICAAASVTDVTADNSGTWPRMRKVSSSATCGGKDEASAADGKLSSKGTYYSTRLKGHQKPKVAFLANSSGMCNFADALFSTQNQFRDTPFVQNASVQLWLRGLHWSTEDECMNTLQSKAVARDLADVSVIAVRNAKDAIFLLCKWSCHVLNDLRKLKRKIDKGQHKHVLTGCDSVSQSTKNLLHNCRSQQFMEVPAVHKHLRLVFAHCSILKQLSERLEKGDDIPENAPSSLDAHYALAMAFENLFEALILCHFKSMVDILDEPLSLRSLKTSVTCIGALATSNCNLCHLLAKAGVVRSLLMVCVEPRYRSIRSLVLRSLATLCCGTFSIQELEESGGVECISEILAEKNSSETEKCEAAGVIAQMTSPLVDSSPNILGLAENLPSLIQSLTALAGTTNSGDGFLLSTAAIGNLTFLSSDACYYLHKCKTVWVLISACRQEQDKCASVFVKDQVATILANMGSVPEGREDIVQSGGIVVLLKFLQMQPSLSSTKVEASACERVQQKSAIALSRLCSDAAVAQQVVSMRGVPRLVTLCKDENERNRSDAVLVACLAVLRKIASSCGLDEFKDLNATELVEPRLLDSFLIYSSRQESYV